ncbi:hypothetical protein IW261DRAFT_27939 [Armillaria novae-zelandiae]|uniref:Uncharacterized protein n=1 Tax=Armillaria novae-zelandiae TaxID=153914 RepID=A0AA39PVS2_9AGAR|nr:hypothetical protein IW261DRAFT_27939 [Armillaria novae-zelandiae]
MNSQQPDSYSDISSASLQADSLQSDYIGPRCSPDQELTAEITRNVSQNSHYDLHCADEPGLAVAHADSDLFTSSQILPETTDRNPDLIQFSPSKEALSSSSPCSSPSKIFSSSPSLSSQTSASTEPSPEESESSKQTLETDHDYDDQSQLISSDVDEQACNEDTGDNYDVDALPPSSSPLPLVSSPFRSSSPLQTVEEDSKDDALLQDHEFFHTPAESESKDIPASRNTSTSDMITEVTQQSAAAPKLPMQEPHSLDDIAPVIPPHVKSHAILAPGPKRPTVMSHLRQHKKLSTPFRSPLIKKEHDQLGSPLPAVSKPLVPAAKTIMHSEVKPVEVKHTVSNDPKKKHRTIRAAAQFKSPLSAAASSHVMPSVRMTPTIQSLERRVQVLRRAVKVKKDGEEELLESLAKRWTEAARELAWELWDLVKDNGANEGGSWGRDPKHKRGFEDSWGWEEKGDQKRLKIENSWGWDEPQRKEGGEDEDQMQGIEPRGENDDARDEGEDKPDNTMGLMLRQFGIAPDTLGWNEEDGMFAESLLR